MVRASPESVAAVGVLLASTGVSGPANRKTDSLRDAASYPTLPAEPSRCSRSAFTAKLLVLRRRVPLSRSAAQRPHLPPDGISRQALTDVT